MNFNATRARPRPDDRIRLSFSPYSASPRNGVTGRIERYQGFTDHATGTRRGWVIWLDNGERVVYGRQYFFIEGEHGHDAHDD